MLSASAQEVERRLGPDELLLDVGGWYEPFARADWVIDLMPYETRKAPVPPGEERFDASRWVERDICDHTPWPFEDGQFDFAVCSHVLEDVRDPIWVCSELCRVARAGYVEVPSRVEEQAWWVNGEWAGWAHHHWLIEIGDDGIEFVFKPHSIHANDAYHLRSPLATALTDTERVQSLFWEGDFEFRERIFYELDEFDAYLRTLVQRWEPELASRLPPPRPLGLERLKTLPRRLLGRAGT